MEAHLLVTCPYNPSHRIRKYKFMNHVSKCKKTASKTENKVECPLDRTHIVDRDYLKEHIASCTSIGKLVDLNTESVGPKDVEPSITINSYNTENWEEEPEVPSYNPMEASAKKPVIRCVSGLTKSEKRKFKEKERMRIANLKGFHSASAASSSLRDTVQEIQEVQEVPLRPPRDTIVSPTKVSQDIFDKTTQIQDHDDNQGASAQASFVPKFHNNTFHRMLYDELAPEDDNINQLEQSLRNTDAISLKDYFQHVTSEDENFSISDRNQETKIKKSDINETSELLTVDNTKQKKDERNMSTSNVPGVRVTNELLTLLKGESSIQKVQPVKNTTKSDQINKDSGEKGLISDGIFKQFNERLAYLRDIQNTAAEESARLLEQLKELKLCEEMVLRK